MMHWQVDETLFAYLKALQVCQKLSVKYYSICPVPSVTRRGNTTSENLLGWRGLLTEDFREACQEATAYQLQLTGVGEQRLQQRS